MLLGGRKMKNSKKIRVMVLYGGRSGEHEISLRSAASVIRFLDPQRYEVLPIAIDKQGKWLLNDISLIEKSAEVLPVYKDAPTVLLPPNPGSAERGLIQLGSQKKTEGIDVVFPVMHGPLCEDGTIQGLLELADVPYVGCGVLSSAVGMDKDIAKRLIRDSGLPIVPYVGFKRDAWVKNSEKIKRQIFKELQFPVFVKPANLGSSVGIHKVKQPDQLEAAIEDALKYDLKIVVEQGISAREIELAVLENIQDGEFPLVSTPGEIRPKHEFYSYDAKYIDVDGAELLLPAPLEPAQVQEARQLAQKAFEALDCEGMARVDLFLDKQTGKFYFNEVNTIPGFTSISMYPKMWEYSGISYTDLLDRLIQLAIARHERKAKLKREYGLSE